MFPVSLDDMVASIQFRSFDLGDALEIDGVRVTTAPLNHPGGATAYRLDYGGRSFVHASTMSIPMPCMSHWYRWRRERTALSMTPYTDDEYTGRRSGESRQQGTPLGKRRCVWQMRRCFAGRTFQHHYERTDVELDDRGLGTRDTSEHDRGPRRVGLRTRR